ncbi:MAG TPA: RloB domain-containing protein [Bacteroidetes bacterium]|nr:RloB domain-containing protein [Bacteroidota bacterium]HEX03856.1 RloB domain-containing protein [Bacteroidota bacterium]
MGSDDLHHKRKARRAKDLARRKSSRAPYDRVLIVCEGGKTEPNYLRELIDCLKLSSANVEVDGDSGSSPIGVVEHAKRRYRVESDEGDEFDRVFCVFDRDTHTTYTAAMNASERFRPSGVFQTIPSVPCFEYWLLLHFVYSTQPYDSAGGRSACDRVIGELRNYMPGYTKRRKGIFREVMSQSNQAVVFSKRALREAENAGTDNPTTRMHELVEYLHQLRK